MHKSKHIKLRTRQYFQVGSCLCTQHVYIGGTATKSVCVVWVRQNFLINVQTKRWFYMHNSFSSAMVTMVLPLQQTRWKRLRKKYVWMMVGCIEHTIRKLHIMIGFRNLSTFQNAPYECVSKTDSRTMPWNNMHK